MMKCTWVFEGEALVRTWTIRSLVSTLSLLLAACGSGSGSGSGGGGSLPCHLVSVGGYQPDELSWTFDVSGDRAIVDSEKFDSARPFAKLSILDVSDPTKPALYGAPIQVDEAHFDSVAITSAKAYATSSGGGQTGLYEIDLSTPALQSPHMLYDDATNAKLALVSESAGYLASHTKGLQYIDLATLSLGAAATSAKGQAIAIDGTRAYLGDQDTGLQVFDLSAPDPMQAPTLLGSYPNPTGGSPADIHAIGSVLAVCGGESVITLDVSDPTSIQPLKIIEADVAESLDAKGRHAYLASGDVGLVVIDITDVRNPVPVQACSTGGYARKVIVKGNYAYILSNETGLRIFDVSGLD
jgi:hypothetical protein